MVAHAATTPSSATGRAPSSALPPSSPSPSSSAPPPLRPFAPSPSSSSPSAPPPLRPFAPSPSFSSPSAPLPLRPFAPSLLSDLSSPDLSFSDIAQKHNLTVEELTLLVRSTELRTLLAATETAACQRVRLVSSLNLHAVARTLITVMDDFNNLAKSHQASGDPAYLTDADYIRASDRARKAAWMLYRLSRITPIDESHLSRTRSLLRATETPTRVPLVPDSDASRHDSEPVSSSSSSSPSPSPSVALRDLRGESSLPPSSSASSAALHVESSSSSPSAPLPLRPFAPSPSPSVALRDLRGESSSASSTSHAETDCSPASAKPAHATLPPSDLLTDSGSLDVHLTVEQDVAPVPGSNLKDPEPGLVAGVPGLPTSSSPSHAPQAPARGRSPTKPRSPRYLVALAGSSP